MIKLRQVVYMPFVEGNPGRKEAMQILNNWADEHKMTNRSFEEDVVYPTDEDFLYADRPITRITITGYAESH